MRKFDPLQLISGMKIESARSSWHHGERSPWELSSNCSRDADALNKLSILNFPRLDVQVCRVTRLGEQIRLVCANVHAILDGIGTRIKTRPSGPRNRRLFCIYLLSCFMEDGIFVLIYPSPLYDLYLEGK